MKIYDIPIYLPIEEGSKSLFERLKLDEDIREYINNEIKTENIRKLLRFEFI